ncbi:MAG: serine/threonine-protein kinase [Planctomycetota bacterium]
MSAPLGELAVAAGLVEPRRLESVLRLLERWRAAGDVRRLGEVLVESLRLPVERVRGLLGAQGLELLACALCRARYGAFGQVAGSPCPRCERPLALAPADAALSTEDTLADASPAAQAQLQALRQRTPRLGPYEVRGEVGRGAMGVIYKAWDPRRARVVALKLLLRPESAGAADHERFRREARAVAALRHPHIVPALGLEEAEGFACIAMDYVPGVTLDLLLGHGALPLPRVVWVVAKIARALDHAHRAGLVHRDVKPGNVLVARDGTPYLFDFGVAKDAGESQSLTADGVALGSLGYMAPEYLLEGPAALGPAYDVYGLGVTLYLVAAGRHPLGDPRAPDFPERVISAEPAPVSTLAPGLPPALAAVIDRAVQKRPEERPPSAAAFADALEAWLATL